MPGTSTPSRSLRNAWLYALPEGRLPPSITCHGREYALVETFKHDFFAATGLYRGPAGLAVLKLNRVQNSFGLPLRSIGRFLARREIRLYRLAHDLPGVPALIGPVGDTGLLHEYVPGHPLGRYEAVADEFFAQLDELLSALHARHIAYVDLNKRQNILVGSDGRPYLIDFQISLHLPPIRLGATPPARWLLARFQHADRYHVLKHKRRLRPEQLSVAEQRALAHLSLGIRMHRWIARPLTLLRRRTLRHLGAADEAVVPGSSAK